MIFSYYDVIKEYNFQSDNKCYYQYISIDTTINGFGFKLNYIQKIIKQYCYYSNE